MTFLRYNIFVGKFTNKISLQNNFSQNWQIVKQLTVTDFKLRYSGSVLGYLWSLLKPLVFFLVLYVVFVKFLRIDGGIKNYSVYLLLGIILWTFFSEATNNGMLAVVGKSAIIKKIYFPRIIVVIAASLNALINLAFNMLVLIGLMVYLQIDVWHIQTLLIVPLILEMWIMSLGLSLLLATMYVRWRDLSHIWELVLQVMFYLTPIIYPITMIPAKYAFWLTILNPMAQIIIDSRRLFLTFTFDPNSYYPWVPVLLTGLIFWLGWTVFERSQKYFVEEI